MSDIGTKNLEDKLFNKHANRVLDGRILECLREDVKMYDVSDTKELVKSSQSQSDES